MKFITDGMLGKITRWLRMLGHNVKYSNKLDDAKLIEIAKKEKRVLLTRDLALYQQATAKGAKAFYLEGKDEAEKLAKLAKKFGFKLEVNTTRSRCPKCNTRIISIRKEEIASEIEETTYKRYNDFWRCPKCGQIYWQGSHWIRIREVLLRAKQLQLYRE